MKRKIMCLPCRDKLMNLLADKQYPGEGWKSEEGKARGHYVCDSCGKPLAEGENIAAVSIWSEEQGGYYEWEHDFINKKG